MALDYERFEKEIDKGIGLYSLVPDATKPVKPAEAQPEAGDQVPQASVIDRASEFLLELDQLDLPPLRLSA